LRVTFSQKAEEQEKLEKYWGNFPYFMAVLFFIDVKFDLESKMPMFHSTLVK
jgi:hypothetical protein